MNTYTLKIEKIAAIPTVGELEKVVKYIAWRYVGTNGTQTTDIYRETVVGEPTEENFTAFESLTESEICSWIESLEDLEAMRGSLDTALTDLASPKIVELSVPWANVDRYVPSHAPHEEPTE